MISVLSGAKHKIAAVCCLIEEDTAGSRLSNTFTTPDSHPYVPIVIQCPCPLCNICTNSPFLISYDMDRPKIVF